MFAADKSYYLPLCVAMHSAIVHGLRNDGSQSIRSITVLTGDVVDDEEMRQFRSAIGAAPELSVIAASQLDVDLDWPVPVFHPRISSISYAALFPNQVMGRISGRVIYLDCDVIVRSNLEALYEAELDGHPVGAVRDAWTKTVDQPSGGIANWSKYAQTGQEPYFNSGVLLFELGEWDRIGAESKILRYLQRERDNMQLGDQEVLNACLAGRIKELGGEWNVVADWYGAYVDNMPPLSSSGEVNIRHFVGRRKPWLPNCPQQPHDDEFQTLRTEVLSKFEAK